MPTAHAIQIVRTVGRRTSPQLLAISIISPTYSLTARRPSCVIHTERWYRLRRHWNLTLNEKNLCVMGAAQVGIKEFAAAIESFARLRKLTDGEELHPVSNLWLAIACWNMDDKDQARELYELSIRQTGDALQSAEYMAVRAEVEQLLGIEHE